VATGDFRPTDQAVAVKEELMQQISAELARYREAVRTTVPALNRQIHEKQIPVILVVSEEKE